MAVKLMEAVRIGTVVWFGYLAGFGNWVLFGQRGRGDGIGDGEGLNW